MAQNGAKERSIMSETVKRRIREVLMTFCMVTTGSIFVCAAYINVFWPGDLQISVDILWQIPTIAFVCSMGNFFHPYREVSRRRTVCDIILHYLYINVVVLGGGYWFEWIERGNLFMPAAMAFGILVVFITVSAVVWSWHKRESETLNRKLQEYQAGGGRTD